MSAAVHAQFFPQARPVVRAFIPPPALRIPSEADVAAAGKRAWSAARREAHRLAVLAIYEAGVNFGRTEITARGSPDEIIRAACLRHGISRPELLGRGRSVSIVSARRDAAKAMHKQFGMSSTEIGRKLNRDHTSVLHLLGRIGHGKPHLSQGSGLDAESTNTAS